MFLQFLRLDGKTFHTVGPVWKKARSPKVFHVALGITSNVSESDRRLYLVLGFTTSSSDKYCGARPFNLLKTRSASASNNGLQGVTWAYKGLQRVQGVAGGYMGLQGRGLHGVKGVTRSHRGLQGVTRGYRGLHGVTGGYRGYKGSQGVTRGYIGLQGVTRSYKGLQRVTMGYKGLQWVTGSYKGLHGATRGYRGLHGVTEGWSYSALQGVSGGY